MARGSAPRTSRRRGRPEDTRGKRKSCPYCKHKVEQVDYKLFRNLRTLISEKGKIRSRRVTGLCRRHQNQAATAVKRAREVALLPYIAS